MVRPFSSTTHQRSMKCRENKTIVRENYRITIRYVVNEFEIWGNPTGTIVLEVLDVKGLETKFM